MLDLMLVVIKENNQIKISTKIIGTGMRIILIEGMISVIEIVGLIVIEEETLIIAVIKGIDKIEAEDQAETIIIIMIDITIKEAIRNRQIEMLVKIGKYKYKFLNTILFQLLL